ncbi:MAG: MgtC/SapB family protein [Thermomicrobiales bacterium]
MTEVEGLLRIGLAAIFGAAIGFDREAHSGSAGLRTHVLVALGAATFTVLGIQVVEARIFEAEPVQVDPTRILGSIISGIGFLGGAIVFRDDERARNVTTAAGIWTVTGVGIAVGLGSYLLAAGATVLILTVLYLLKVAQRWTGTR